MKVLVSAIACSPLRGSEGAVGWTVVNALARRHEVWVMTHEESRPEIESWQEKHFLPPLLHIEYLGKIGQYSNNPMVNRFQCWRTNYAWHSKVLEFARHLHGKFHFDLVHHVTCATWRVASPFWELGIPVVWGPLGGGERFPIGFAGILSKQAMLFEALRGVSNHLSALSPAIRRSARNVSACIAANQETYDLLRSMRGTDTGMSKLLQVFFPAEKIEAFAPEVPKKDFHGPLRIFAGGNLEARKGVALALRALRKVHDVAYLYTLGGNGPEKQHLQNLAETLGLGNRVIFTDGFKGDAYREELLKSHVYLLPSLRDSAGITLMEAMLAGCVPIVADCGGPHDIVTDACGVRVPITSPEVMETEIAKSLEMLSSDRNRLREYGMAAHQRIARAYTEENYMHTLDFIYKQVARRKP